MGTGKQDALAEALNALWRQYLPQMQERVAAIASAADKLQRGEEGEHASLAGAEAHKLAGVLGTFGLARGTDLARDAEMLCNNAAADDAGQLGARLARIADELSQVLASRE